MEMWIIVGGIWLLAMVCLTLFIRGASPARNRALAMARSRERRLKHREAGNARETTAASER
ncbi:hypothetical protein B0G57_11089 [Trinickia symbiotica]|uniref:Uncharacterized protein n=1 Tax=Trinickia symbiotica TaxID=863227 RepID=A0A2N7X726_9BURK|nr:hypothetical protein [Trinickia symbiotica]PMS37568.1 hypothetical protein C0Z20_06275 [Trinickia symbiotica]PPK44017.1 hypothetical protein B0G57_11089 [Trinickia symbiotica]